MFHLTNKILQRNYFLTGQRRVSMTSCGNSLNAIAGMLHYNRQVMSKRFAL